MTTILMLADAFQPCPHSASQRVSSFAQSFSDRGLKVTVVTANQCLKGKRRSVSGSKRLVYSLRYPRSLLSVSGLITNPILVFLYIVSSIIVILEQKVEVIFASVPNGEVAVAGFLASRIFRIPLVVDIRDMYPPPSTEFPYLAIHLPTTLNRVLVWFYQFLYRNSAMIVAVNSEIKENMVFAGIEAGRVTVIPNGADTSMYRLSGAEERANIRTKYSLSKSGLVFVYAGALSSYYPVTEVIRGLNEALPSIDDGQLLIVSHTDYRHLLGTVERLGLKERVQFMGPLSVRETSEVLSACDVGIVTYPGGEYWKNMYGGKIFSYMGCGLPILASGPRDSVIKELIEDNGIGFFVGSPCKENFAEGFKYFFHNAKQQKRMGARARETVEKFFDRRKLGSQLAELIYELTIRAQRNP